MLPKLRPALAKAALLIGNPVTARGRIEPDHVILGFHLNDCEITPRLFANSQVYRAWIALVRSPRSDALAIADAVDATLLSWIGELEREGIRFSVLVIPYMSAYEEWEPRARFAASGSRSGPRPIR